MSMFFDWDVATWIFSHIPAWMSISNPWYGFVSNWELIILKSSGLTANFRLPHFRTISYCTHIVFHRSIFWQGNLHGWTACPADGVSRLGNKHVMELDPDVSGSDDFWRPQPLEPEVFSPAELGKTWELRICSSCSSCISWSWSLSPLPGMEGAKLAAIRRRRFLRCLCSSSNTERNFPDFDNYCGIMCILFSSNACK